MIQFMITYKYQKTKLSKTRSKDIIETRYRLAIFPRALTNCNRMKSQKQDRF